MSGTNPTQTSAQPTNGGTAMAAGTVGATSGSGILLVWAMKQFLGIDMPVDAALAAVGVLTPIVHWAVVRMNEPARVGQ